MRPASEKPPDVSIDEALRLFLGVAYPNGLPEGVDPEQLLETLRKKVAAERPEWAAAGPAQEPSPSAAPAYSQVKAEIAERARQEEVPEDPEDRYLYERAKEARRNREERRAEERDGQTREALRQRLLTKKKDADEATLERALRIRQMLEERVKGILKARARETPRPERLTTGAPARPELARPALEAPGSLELEGAGAIALPAFSAPPAPKPAPPPPSKPARELFEDLRHLEPDEKIESLRRFNQARRERLRPRREVLSPRRPERPSRRRESLSVESGTRERPMGLEFEDPASDEDFGLKMTTESKSRGLSLT